MKDTTNTTNTSDRSGPGLTTTALSNDEFQSGSDKSATGIRPTIKMVYENINIGTWNVHTLNACGKVNKLGTWAEALPAGHIRSCWNKMDRSRRNHLWRRTKTCYSSEETQHQYCIGFIVRKEVTGDIMSCTPVSSRIITIRESAKPQIITII